jgi:hypothetical protein
MRISVLEDTVFVNKNLSFYRNTEDYTASSKKYEAEDFCLYMETILDIKSRHQDFEDKFFDLYCNRFILLTYIKNYVRYTDEENDKIVHLAKRILTGKYKFVLKCLVLFPYKNMYPFFKLIRING